MPVTINGNGTITGVSVGGLPDGIVDTDMLANGAVTAAKRGAGAILQVKHSFSDVFSTTSTSYVDSGLSVTITPTSSSSKFIINVNAIGSASSDNSSQGVFRIVRDSTTVAGQKTLTVSSGAYGEAFAVVEGTRERYPVTTSLEDSPNTTSSITYKLRVLSPFGDTIYLGRWGTNNDWSVNSYMTVYEVAA